MKITIKQVNQGYKMISIVYLGMGTAFTSQVVVKDESPVPEILFAQGALEKWLEHVDEVFSTYKENSEVSKYNRGEVDFLSMSEEMRFVYVSCAQASEATHHSFNAMLPSGYDPSGFVKGWAIEEGFNRYLRPLLDLNNVIGANLNGGGDMQMASKEESDWNFEIAVLDPFDKTKIIAELSMKKGAIATSGISERGNHIFGADKNILQTTVIGVNLQEVDVWATALMVDFNSKMPNYLRAFEVNRHGIIVEKEVITNAKET
ncbi:FAD:protein FMN transferase [Lactovum miscens]|uniref:FAD:protein FMN transferase n=1 Tax=Lactovum miscens TaxID=190387 RepID=A0A841C5A3_9LACT|nr:FAD:protein FMN transferase [Lactovum miscens]MBB5887983.1 thiamine biosynthesis lipoprotein [Lactovum miscens]